MPLTRLSLQERIKCIRLFSTYEKASNIQKAWRKEFKTEPPSRKTITSLNKKFDATGSVADLSRSGRPVTVRTQEIVEEVQQALAQDPTKSIRNLSSELGLDKAVVHRIKQASAGKKSFIRLENNKLKEKNLDLQRQIMKLEAKLREANQAGPQGFKEEHRSSNGVMDTSTTSAATVVVDTDELVNRVVCSDPMLSGLKNFKHNQTIQVAAYTPNHVVVHPPKELFCEFIPGRVHLLISEDAYNTPYPNIAMHSPLQILAVANSNT